MQLHAGRMSRLVWVVEHGKNNFNAVNIVNFNVNQSEYMVGKDGQVSTAMRCDVLRSEAIRCDGPPPPPPTLPLMHVPGLCLLRDGASNKVIIV